MASGRSTSIILDGMSLGKSDECSLYNILTATSVGLLPAGASVGHAGHGRHNGDAANFKKASSSRPFSIDEGLFQSIFPTFYAQIRD